MSQQPTANDRQVGGAHYKKFAIEVWDFISQNEIPYLEGNAIKYIARWRDKGGIADLQKAQHYIQKIIENAEYELATAQMDDLLAALKTAQASEGVRRAVQDIEDNYSRCVTSDAGLVGGMYGILKEGEIKFTGGKDAK